MFKMGQFPGALQCLPAFPVTRRKLKQGEQPMINILLNKKWHN